MADDLSPILPMPGEDPDSVPIEGGEPAEDETTAPPAGTGDTPRATPADTSLAPAEAPVPDDANLAEPLRTDGIIRDFVTEGDPTGE